MADFETFNLVFKADSSQLKKEVDDVKKKTNELTDTSKKSEEQTKKTDKEFENLAKSLGKVAATYFSVGAVINSFQSSVAKTTGLADFARDSGVAIEVISAWGTALEEFGVDASIFKTTIDALHTTFKGNATRISIAESLPDFIDNIKRLEKSETGSGRRFAENQGVPAEFISFALATDKAILDSLNAIQGGTGVTTAEEAKRVTEFNTATAKLSTAFDDLNKVMVNKALPNLTKFADFLTMVVESFTFFSKDENRIDYKKLNYGTKEEREIEFSKLKKEKEPKSASGYPNQTGIVDDPNADTSQINLGNTGKFQRDHRGTDLGIGPQSYYIPPNIAPVSNSQATNLAFNGDVHVNTTAQDAKGIADGIMSELGSQGKTMLAQLQQSNAYFDNSVVI